MASERTLHWRERYRRRLEATRAVPPDLSAKKDPLPPMRKWVSDNLAAETPNEKVSDRPR